MRDFRVQSSLFFGPMDLLVQLVRAHEIDPLAIGIADIAAAFLRALEARSEPVDLDEVGEFLVLATTLMELKSRMLLPHDVEEAEAALEPAKQEFLKQLLEYRRFNEAASQLWQKAVEHQKQLPRQVRDVERKRDPSQQPIRELELWDLVSAFSRLMKENIVPVSEAVARDPTPMDVHMDRLESAVMASGGRSFEDLFGRGNSKPALIGKFLALLELIKLRRVWVEWNEAGDSIVVLPPRPEDEPLVPTTDDAVMADSTPPPDAAGEVAAARRRRADRAGSFAAEVERFESDPQIAAELETFDRFTAELLEAPPRRSAWDDYEPLIDETPTDEDDAASNDDGRRR